MAIKKPKTKATASATKKKAPKGGASGTPEEKYKKAWREEKEENDDLRRRLRRKDATIATLNKKLAAAAKATPKPTAAPAAARPPQADRAPMDNTPSSARPFAGFARERAAYAAHKADLLARAEGKYVAIVGDVIDGPYDGQEAAMTAGYKRFGLGPLYIKQIAADEPAVTISRDVAPCRS